MRHSPAFGLVAETLARRTIEYTEWTPDDNLRHSRFVAFREDKRAREVQRER